MPSTIDFLDRLIAIPTVSRDSNLALISYIQDYLHGLGIETLLAPSADGKKANLWATIGPKDKAGVVLSGHTDVVPVDGQNWSSDPFHLIELDGTYYGRGTADMKGFIACCLSMAEMAKKAKLATPIHFAFSYDEEIGCVGVRRLLDLLKDAPVKPRLCIVGEPTLMQAVTAHKGKLGYRVTAHGLEAHSSLAPIGVNAVYMAADLVHAIRKEQQNIAEHGKRDGDYEVPYTTLHVGKLSGGDVMNIVPNKATLDFEIRYLPEEDGSAISKRIQRAADDIADGYKPRVCQGAV